MSLNRNGSFSLYSDGLIDFIELSRNRMRADLGVDKLPMEKIVEASWTGLREKQFAAPRGDE